jgi:uncharacterized membrane protein (UPF0127 family)
MNGVLFFLRNSGKDMDQLTSLVINDDETRRLLGKNLTYYFLTRAGKSTCNEAIDEAARPYYCFSNISAGFQNAVNSVSDSIDKCDEFKSADLTITSASDTTKIKVNANIAITPEQIDLGLGGLESLPPNHGLLIYTTTAEQAGGITAKDVKFPLDIIFIDSSDTVVKISKNINGGETAQSETPFKFALEVNAGFCDKNSIQESDKVVLPF